MSASYRAIARPSRAEVLLAVMRRLGETHTGARSPGFAAPVKSTDLGMGQIRPHLGAGAGGWGVVFLTYSETDASCAALDAQSVCFNTPCG